MFQNCSQKSNNKKHHLRYTLLFVTVTQNTQAPKVSSSKTSGVNMEFSPARVSKIMGREAPPTPKTIPASTSTSTQSHMNNGPLQQHPREHESSVYNVCVWSSGCAVWIPSVCNTQSWVENVIHLLFWITIYEHMIHMVPVNPSFPIHHYVCSKLIENC